MWLPQRLSLTLRLFEVVLLGGLVALPTYSQGTISTVAGNGTIDDLAQPYDVAVDSGGSLYIADTYNHRIRRVTPAGIVSTIAGNGISGFSGDGGSANAAQLNYPYHVAVDGAGNIFIADSGNSRIRKVTPVGIISTVAGNGISGFSDDGGSAKAAQLNRPTGVVVDRVGNLYIADSHNHRIRKVTPTGTISTVAGNGINGFSGDGGNATAAMLNGPFGVAMDSGGNLYIADCWNSRIRKITPAGIISTVAGNGISGFGGDGGNATTAMIRGATALAVDNEGSLYIADSWNSRIRKVTPAGIISTVAGNGISGFSGDGGGATDAMLRGPTAVAVDSGNNLYIADSYNHRIRKVTPGSNAPIG